MKDEMAQVPGRPGASRGPVAHRPAVQRPHPAGRRARSGEDAGGQGAVRLAARQLRALPVHARPAARRHRRHHDLQPAGGEVRAEAGPIFDNLILADEINRAPAKVQSALLEAMQEHQVTIGDTTYPLPEPFLVLATQNPIDQEGTYPLPEAQLDRFLLKVSVGYPTQGRGAASILDRMATSTPALPDQDRGHPAAGRRIAARIVNQVYIDPAIREYIVEIIHATRFPAQGRRRPRRTSSAPAPRRAARSISR